MGLMAKEQPKPTDRHKKKPFQLRLHPLLRKQLDKLVEQNASTMTEEIAAALRKHLREHGLWPVPDKA